MKRRELLLLGATLAWPGATSAQQPRKLHRVGVLESIPLASNRNFPAFQRGLRELGYVEGQNLLIEYRSSDGMAERFPELMLDLVRLKADVVLVRGTPAAMAAKRAGTIPVVMAASADPVGPGVVSSLAHPGGNVTGLTTLVSELAGKRLAILKELVPSTARIAALLGVNNPVRAGQWAEIEKAARKLELEARMLDVQNAESLRSAFTAAVAARTDALLISNEGLLLANRRMIVELAAQHSLPAMYAAREFVDIGGLISYGVLYPDLYYRAATYVDKVLKGAKPADLPIGQPNKLELVVNQKTAEALGLKIPLSLRVRADEVLV